MRLFSSCSSSGGSGGGGKRLRQGGAIREKKSGDWKKIWGRKVGGGRKRSEKFHFLPRFYFIFFFISICFVGFNFYGAKKREKKLNPLLGHSSVWFAKCQTSLLLFYHAMKSSSVLRRIHFSVDSTHIKLQRASGAPNLLSYSRLSPAGYRGLSGE